jgi:hypothetical protein
MVVMPPLLMNNGALHLAKPGQVQQLLGVGASQLRSGVQRQLQIEVS